MPSPLSVLMGAALAGAWLLPLEASAQAPAEPAPAEPAPAGDSQTDELSPAAVKLFREGRELVALKDWKGACAKFDASLAVQRTSAALLNLGLCHEEQGLLATAWRYYDRARQVGLEKQDKERIAAASQAMAALEPRMRRVAFDFAERPPGLELSIDGIGFGGRELDLPLPIDPGEHQITITAPGRVAQTQRVVAPEEGQIVRLPVAALARELEPVPPPTGPGEQPEPRGYFDSPLHVSGAVLAGVGAVGLVVGSVFGAKAIDRADAMETLCGNDLDSNPNVCSSPEGQEARQDAQDAALVSTLGISLGAASALAGVLALSWPVAEPEAQTTLHLAPLCPMFGASAAPNGLLVRGRF